MLDDGFDAWPMSGARKMRALKERAYLSPRRRLPHIVETTRIKGLPMTDRAFRELRHGFTLMAKQMLYIFRRHFRFIRSSEVTRSPHYHHLISMFRWRTGC